MMDSNISDSMAKSIFNNEIIQNMTDETFDKILDGIGFTVPDILRDIPVFKYVVSLYSLSSDIIKCMEVKRQLRFLRELSKCSVNQKELNKRRIAYQNKEKWVYREIEQLCLFISRSNDVNKSQIQAYLYISLVNKDIEYKDFVEYLQVVDMTASILARDNKMPMWVFGLNEENSIVNTINGKFNGTKVTV